MEKFKSESIIDFLTPIRRMNHTYFIWKSIKWLDSFKCKKCNHTKCTIRKSNYARDYNLCHQRESPAANILFHKVKFGVRYAFTIVF